VRRGWLAASLAVAIVVAVVGGWVWSRAGDGTSGDDEEQVMLDEPGLFQEPSIATNAPVRGTRLPDVELETINGDTLRTGELIGTPLVMNVWFTTCPPCRREMPALAAVHAEYGDRVRFVGINPRDDGPSAQSFAEERGVRYENYLDPNGEFLAAAGIGTFPSTLLVSTDGTIVRLRAGEVDQTTLASLIEEDLLS
jgi:thiol-disulfide isomerase/thioredoxin